MKEEIDRGIRSVFRQPHHRAEIMIGSGGTFTALAHMSKFQREGRHGSVQGYALTPSDIVHLLRHMRDSSLEARREIPGYLNQDSSDCARQRRELADGDLSQQAVIETTELEPAFRHEMRRAGVVELNRDGRLWRIDNRHGLYRRTLSQSVRKEVDLHPGSEGELQ
jgi:hypothetical protein